MTQEDKELLLKELCARLPYGVKFRYKYIDNFFHEIYTSSELIGVLLPHHIIHSTFTGNEYLHIERDEIKPYLFPMSSMTEEQKVDMIKSSCGIGSDKNVFGWYNKNHFDYRGLIPLDLAIDATGLNIY